MTEEWRPGETIQDLIDDEVFRLNIDCLPEGVAPQEIISSTEIKMPLGVFLAALDCATGRNSPSLNLLQRVQASNGVRIALDLFLEEAIEAQNTQKEQAQ